MQRASAADGTQDPAPFLGNVRPVGAFPLRHGPCPSAYPYLS